MAMPEKQRNRTTAGIEPSLSAPFPLPPMLGILEGAPRRLWWLRLSAVLLVVCATLALVQPAPVDAARKHALNFASKEPETLDPHTSILGQVQVIVRFVYRGLTRFAIKDGKVTTAEVEPDLAESWTMSDDGTEWTFKLRKEVQFHKDFGEMTAEDVKFSFERQIKHTKGMLCWHLT